MARASGGPEAAVAAEVREAAMRGEPDRYLAATLAPRGVQADLAALAAFAAEISRVPATVSEPMLGSIRLQWWRDALGEAGSSGTRTGHPIADVVRAAVVRHGLPQPALEAMIDAREHDLSGGLVSDDQALWAYLEATEGTPFRLALAIIGIRSAEGDALATEAGRAYGLARALGRLPMLLHNGGLPLPADRLRAAGADPERLGDQPASDTTLRAAAAVAAELRPAALEAHAAARSRLRAMPRVARTVVLPLAMVGPYFQAQTPGARLDRMAPVSPLRRATRLAAAYLTGRL
jgi:phytoene synthase